MANALATSASEMLLHMQMIMSGPRVLSKH